MLIRSIFILCVAILTGITLTVMPEVHAQERSVEPLDFEIPKPPENQDWIPIDEHSEYTFDATIINPGNISYEFTLEPLPEQRAYGHVPAPDGATITPQGTFSWTPDSSGTYEVVIVAADDDRMAGKQAVTITVSDP